ncbi:MAG: endopeptidase La [Myxococcales bacterium]|nr:endopeptidase La [Myxococcales bacterium]MCB9708864.1 endopeptidase La [Myxococcales bacterium]
MSTLSDSASLEALAILPLRDTVVFPAAVLPIHIAREPSIKLIDMLLRRPHRIMGVVAQRGNRSDFPAYDQIYHVGTLVRLLKVIRLHKGNYSVVIQGVGRIKLLGEVEGAPYLQAGVERVPESTIRDEEIDALAVHLREIARSVFSGQSQVSQEASTMLDKIKDPGSLADLVTSHLPLSAETKQHVLEAFDLRHRLRTVVEALGRHQEVSRVKEEISTIVQQEMTSSQRDQLLRQQMRTIRRELGDSDESEDELDALEEKLSHVSLPDEAYAMAKKQLSRLRIMSSQSAEFHVGRAHLEWLLELPWNTSVPERIDIAEVRCVLDEDHYGLERIKKRILEHIAVRKLRTDAKGPLLCLAGPPGVGKTSLGKSIARAMGRPFVRVSLGGVQDEAEIRGHRRTYVGSLPGRIVSALRKVGANNPVMVLDEIDKLSSESRGSPASALLEVLDPEQNYAFLDNYIEVPVDLRKILFIATANRKDTIPHALLDRFEVVDIPGYTREEKLAIAEQFLMPKQLSEHGLSPERLEVSKEALDFIVDCYTREAGVRGLERQLASLCRDVAFRVASGDEVNVAGTEAYVQKVLGPPPYQLQMPEREIQPGLATALSWTPAGGDLMFVESSRMPGRGNIHLTGQMGKIMKESVATAFTYIRARASSLGLNDDFLTRIDVHVHLPQGAVQKDGASAGVAIYASLASMLMKTSLRGDVGMIGEISLRGSVLRAERVKEKCLAAHRARLTRILLPRLNEPDLDEVPTHVRNDLDIRLISKVDEVLPLVMQERVLS